MYVRKFEADSMEEALKAIKQELGPDAIILKTVSNKGIKGAFKKNRIEITAAISEKNYTKKAKVDAILDNGQKDEFYSGSSNFISNMIDNYHQHQDEKTSRFTASNNDYGKMGLNRPVKRNDMQEQASDVMGQSQLDDFLGPEEKVEASNYHRQEAVLETAEPPHQNYQLEDKVANDTFTRPDNSHLEKIDLLEQKIFSLTQKMEAFSRPEPKGLFQLKSTLKSFDINDQFLQFLMKKCSYELNENQLENADEVFEFGLKEMMESIHLAMPQFSTMESESPIVTVFLSESSSGQSSIIKKIAAMKKDCIVIHNGEENDYKGLKNFFDIKIEKGNTISELVSMIRKGIEAGKQIFVDFNCNQNDMENTKRFIDGLNRSFQNVEVLICLSSICSELYNKKVINRYAPLSRGIVVTHLDLCLNYGSLFNLSWEYENLPFMFYSTGKAIPDDIETATAERILAGIFQF